MLRVTIELLPGGHRELRRTIASMTIGNQSNLADISDYRIDAVESANPLTSKPACNATCVVVGHDRRQSVWNLIAKAAAEIEKAEFDDGSSDLTIATRSIASLHFSAGLGGGDLAYLGDETAAAEMMRLDARLRAAVNAELVWLHGRAVEILRRERAALDAIAQALAGRRHLAGDEIRRLFAENSNPKEN